MAHTCTSNVAPSCNGEMDCPCNCNNCNGEARRQLLGYVKNLTLNEADRLKPIFEGMLKPD